MSSANIHVSAADVGEAYAWVTDGRAMWRVALFTHGSIAIAGQIDAARALRDALNLVIEQADALTGGES